MDTLEEVVKREREEAKLEGMKEGRILGKIEGQKVGIQIGKLLEEMGVPRMDTLEEGSKKGKRRS